MNDTSLNTIAALALPFDGALPCGANLEYDPQFLAFEEALRDKPEVHYGSTVTPAVAPDWKAVRVAALALLERSRDLRVAIGLTRTLLELDGVPGLAAGLSLTAALLEQQWHDVHPQLEADDDGDPTLRVNTLAVLVAPGGVLRQLRDTPLVEARAVGVFSLRDIEAAAQGQEGADGAAIDAAWAAAPPEQLLATAAALEAASAGVHAIEAVLGAHLAPGMELDLAPLAELLQRGRTLLLPHLAAGAHVLASDAAGNAAPGAPSAVVAGEIASRDDVVRTLERLCGWYARHEPSSPVPLLLQRARGLVEMNFTELMQELAPDGLGQLAQVTGMRPES